MFLAIVASAALSLGLYFMKQQATELPSLDGGWRIGAWVAFARDPLWLLGVGLQVVGYGLYLWALSDTPLSVVHTALTGGIAIFVLLAIVGLHEKPQPSEWLGLAAVLGGLGLLAISSQSSESTRDVGWVHANTFALVSCLIAVAALFLETRVGGAIGWSIASGMMLGLAGLYAKELTSSAARGLPLALTLATNIVGFALMQAALQKGRGIVVMPIFSTLSNIVPIAAGFLVFGDELPSDSLKSALHVAAIAMALAGAGLLARASEVDDRSDSNSIPS